MGKEVGREGEGGRLVPAPVLPTAAPESKHRRSTRNAQLLLIIRRGSARPHRYGDTFCLLHSGQRLTPFFSLLTVLLPSTAR